MFNLDQLPYKNTALEPYISSRTVDFHYGKHQQAYLNNVNKLVEGSELENNSLEDIIVKTANDDEQKAIFNNAAQYYNHVFFWQGLRTNNGKKEIDEVTLRLINDNFISLDNFYDQVKTKALSLFGSGWVFLVKDGDFLKVLSFKNADNPLAHNLKPVWALDVWEHAYYLDYQNARSEFVKAVLFNLINWQFITKNI